MSRFPHRRLRRTRRTPGLRRLRCETRLTPADLICPLFVVEDPADAGPVASMPGVQRYTVEQLADPIERLRAGGVEHVLLFGVPATKDAQAGRSVAADAVVGRAVAALHAHAPGLTVITDVCVCAYTDHGHCGLLRGREIDNDATLDLLAEMALRHAEAGADCVAPSAMMDGQVVALRQRLDAAGFIDTGILAYAAKFASCFYGPFREAGSSAPQFGDRRAYQLDPANAAEALAEAVADWEEGADWLMVKPALPYLDIIHRVKQTCPHAPLVAYQVSGEYSQIQAAVRAGWVDERQAVLETLTAIKRAGADAIITYWAPQVAAWLAD